MTLRLCRILTICIVAYVLPYTLRCETRTATPADYHALLKQLQPGDTLYLAAGNYPRLYLSGLRGNDNAWIRIVGPDSGPPAVIEGDADHNTVEIENSSYLSIENLRIDSLGIEGVFGVSAKGGTANLTHHIRLDGNTFVGQYSGQGTVAISTKIPTWGWEIRYNRILGAGTGMYLGNSDATQPFVAGIIENNLIKDTIGYNIEIKDQREIPKVPGMPLEPTATIIRNNVFVKNNAASPGGDRPNLLVGAFPDSGPGSLNMYEIYGNLFVHNPREALFQGSGAVSLHDNVFLDGCPRYPAVVLTKQNKPLQVAWIYNNTVYTTGPGIRFGSPALKSDAVVGNLVFASSNPFEGPIGNLADNITGAFESAAQAVRSPSLNPAKADFYPLEGKCQGSPIDLARFETDGDYSLDFNGRSKLDAKRIFRGAYAGQGQNPGWQLQMGVKPPNAPLPRAN